MRVSCDWLSDYIDLKITPGELADLLTLSGVEVGAVEHFGPALQGVVVGRVEAVRPHPNRAKLVVVSTEIGGTNLEIVCGAKNMQVGDLVAVAVPGSRLPGPGVIEETMIYGEKSSGMLCSARELGLEIGSEDEILILGNSAVPGDPVGNALGFGDQILCLELTPNRADCLSMIGVAHEVAALTGEKVRVPLLNPPQLTESVTAAIRVSVADRELCPRYTVRVFRNITIAPSPLWMQLRLLKAGIRPINNIVDITNYVMWECGQPLHAFDLELLEEDQILVRRAKQGEKLVTLDGVQRNLDPEALVITDGARPVGLAGVMGGENTEINLSTRQVLLEAACFNPTNIRRTAHRYNLPSEASQRFEKGVNPEAVLWSQDRSAQLMARLAAGEALQGVLDLDYAPVRRTRIEVLPERVNKILGLEIPVDRVTGILSRLGFEVQDGRDSGLTVVVPLRRGDITIEEDVVEEIARLHGYDKIPVTLPSGEMLENRETTAEKLQSLVRNLMVSCGYFECLNYSFINPVHLQRLRLNDDDPRLRAIPLQNPFSEEQSVMRTTLVPGLMKSLRHNLGHRELNQMLFEIGSVYLSRKLPLEELPDEKNRLAIAVTGHVPEPNWVIPAREADYFLIKGTLEALFSRLQIKDAVFTPATATFTHPTRGAVITVKGDEIGWLGQIHPVVAESWEINQSVTLCEIDLESLAAHAALIPGVVPLPRYPAARRDIAVVAPRSISSGQLEAAIREAGGGIVSRVELFDLYEGHQIPEDKRSLAYSITYRHDEGTLTDAEVNRAQGKIEKAIIDLGAVLRG